MVTPYSHWTSDEKARVTAAMRQLAPDYQLYDHNALLHHVRNAVEHYGLDVDSPFSGPAAIKLTILHDHFSNGMCKFGGPEAWWWIALYRAIFFGSNYDTDPWLEVKWWLWLELRGKRSVLTLWGCTNSAKSMWMATFAFVQGAVWLGDCEGYIAGPYKNASDDKVWDAVDKAKARLNMEVLHHLGVTGIRLTADYFNVEGHHHSGEGTHESQIKFVSVDKAAAIQGKKLDSKDPRYGILLLECDEFIENSELDLGEGIANNRGQKTFFAALACNPKKGKVWHAKVRKWSEPIDIPAGKMRKSVHRRWKTRLGLCVRFDASNSPNQILGRDEFKYLFDSETEADMEKEDDANKSAQKDAWAFGDIGAESPTDYFRQARAGLFDQFYWLRQEEQVMALDPSFGGGDECIFTIIQPGLFEAVSASGEHRQVNGCVLKGHYEIDMEDHSDFVVDPDFIQLSSFVARHRMEHYPEEGKTELSDYLPARLEVGTTISGARYLAVQAAYQSIQHKIPWSRFVFEGSQRVDCADAIWEVFGRQNINWYYEGTRKLRHEEEPDLYRWPWSYRKTEEGRKADRWSDYCSSLISMLWFLSCELLHSGFVVGGTDCQRGLDELASREIVYGRGELRDVISKKKLKDAGMKSPAYGETLSMALYFACRYLNAFDLGRPEDVTDISDMELPFGPDDLPPSRFNIKGKVLRG